MKAFLFDDKNKKRNRSVLVLLPSGKLETGVGDPANIAIELDGDNIRAWIIYSDEVALLELVKEVEVEGRFLVDALRYRSARIQYERESLKFKEKLINLMITPNCDAWTFLDTGSVVL